MAYVVVFGAIGIVAALIRLAVLLLRLLVSIICRIAGCVQTRREDRTALELFRYRLRQAQMQGADIVSTEGLWR